VSLFEAQSYLSGRILRSFANIWGISHEGRTNIRRLKDMLKMKPKPGSAAPNKESIHETSRGAPPTNILDPGPSVQRTAHQNVDQDENVGGVEDDDSEFPPLEEISKKRSVETAMAFLKASQKEKNKENIPTSEESRRVQKLPFNTKTVQGVRVGWDTQQSESASTQAREESQQSEDTAFESDNRTMNAPRRTARQNGPTEVSSPPRSKRQREVSPQPRQRPQAVQVEDEVEYEDDQPQKKRVSLQQSQRRLRAQEASEDEDEAEEATPLPTATQAKEAARARVARAKPFESQTRTPWSVHDEQELIRLIEEYGCSWSKLMLLGHFERDTNEVALKDKARNMKVAFLKYVSFHV
jgi:hypothetical protein